MKSDLSGINSIMPTYYYKAQAGQNQINGADGSDFEASLKKAMSEGDEKKLRKACADLESFFVSQMFKAMRKTVPKSQLFDTDTGTKIFEEMFDEELAKAVSEGKGMGLGEQLYKQLLNRMKNQYKVNDGNE